jgi:hypothetical protein
MSTFSLDWFKQELAKLQLEEQRLKNEMMRAELEKQKVEEEEEDECDCCDDEDWDDEDGDYKWDGTQNFGDDYDVDVPYVKPYLHLKMVNDVLTIVLQDGQIISKPNATQDDFKAAQNATSEADLFSLVMSQEVKDEKMKREEREKIR